jgi:hypothetical protein
LRVFLTFIIFPFYNLTFTEQSQVTLQLRVSVSALVSRFLALLPLAEGPEKLIHRDPNPFLRPYQQGSFETTMAVPAIIAILLIAAIVTGIW